MDARMWISWRAQMAPCFYRRRRNVIYIQDNASYHKEEEVQEWFKSQLQVAGSFNPCLPTLPEFNAAGTLWHQCLACREHTIVASKNRQEILESLRRVFP